MVMRVKRPNHGIQQWWPVVAVPLLLGMVLGLMAFYWMLPFRAPSESGELLASLETLQEELRRVEAERDTLQQRVEAQRQVCTNPHAAEGPNEDKERGDPELAAFMKKVAVNDEVLLAVSNHNLAYPGGMLEFWAKHVKAAGVRNAMVLALDDPAKEAMERAGIPALRMDVEIPESQKKAGANHAVSALKFRILKRFLTAGYSVFLSDVDVMVLQNPFNFLVRDSDVEGMSDGWDNATAYGYNDVMDDERMGWGRYVHSMRVFVTNSGTFYIRPTPAALALMDSVIERLETTGGWDQAVFNEEIHFPNSPMHKAPGVSLRVLDMYDFLNSKTLFARVRHDPALRSRRPVMLHLNSHPEKWERLQAAEGWYVRGQLERLMAFPDGSGMPSRQR